MKHPPLSEPRTEPVTQIVLYGQTDIRVAHRRLLNDTQGLLHIGAEQQAK